MVSLQRADADGRHLGHRELLQRERAVLRDHLLRRRVAAHEVGVDLAWRQTDNAYTWHTHDTHGTHEVGVDLAWGQTAHAS